MASFISRTTLRSSSRGSQTTATEGSPAITSRHQFMQPSDYTAPQFQLSALITIDTQRDVLDGQPLEVPGTSAALPKMRTLAGAFRGAGRPIVHVVRLYRRDGS